MVAIPTTNTPQRNPITAVDISLKSDHAVAMIPVHQICGSDSIMSSSAPEFSDNSESEVQQSQLDAQIHSSPPATGISHPSISTPNIPYPTQLGANALGQAAYPYPDPYYRSIYTPYESQPYPTQPYPVQPMVHLQLMGIQQAGVPLPSDTVEEPVFVNAKQYHGILRRRQCRAKAESENKAHKSRKPYLHESRHLHALRRSRGCGGRFEKKDKHQKEMGSDDNSESQVNINLNSDKT
ncbi:CCAAT-binding factor, conserved site-containing protein [Cynara cardunculus var. scolymus]|uniref:Nuclear transcription factor Y subunit n=2 Tax=Cynara cardunculus var. scolymus TaxID=59895 RepID=A0A103Y1G5_CYNCS|nr:CCAAT-binding factor, conserved site-containing protein [Cynara cardunculus var. scolymus]